MGQPRRDRWGRYILPDPITGEERTWTRATTWANTIGDTYGLTRWKQRMTARGVALRDDLRVLAASLDVDDRKQWDSLTDDAIEAAGGGTGANFGTALHKFTQRLDSGEHVTVPAPWDQDVAAYRATLAAVGIRILPQFIERVVVVPEFGVAGTLDRIVGFEDGYHIADVKTSADLDYSWGEIAIQEALYAHATAMWDMARKSYVPFPVVDRTRGVVIHLPVGQARCDMYWIDLEAGWHAASIAELVREWRQRKDLHRPFDRLREQLELSLQATSGEDR